ncbi:TetR family transcriptional regulator [Pseudonocardia sp. TMWB2A]|uniref:TetR/AcrR family transcriptional regulator n=1 Tax=Pseudonocardia sp. TMWB2A TaxID=687430 RepID=UPI00307CE48F
MDDDGRDRPPVSTGRSERARTAALEAALALAVELPYPQVTMEAIAARAGVGKATLYRRWRHRGALLVDAVAHRNARAAVGDGGIPDTGDLQADLSAVLRAVVDELAVPAWDALLRALCVEALVDTAVGAQVLEEVFAPQITLFARRFATARTTGHIDGSVGDVEAFELFVAPLFHRWQLRTGALDHAYADAVVRRGCRALSP